MPVTHDLFSKQEVYLQLEEFKQCLTSELLSAAAPGCSSELWTWRALCDAQQTSAGSVLSKLGSCTLVLVVSLILSRAWEMLLQFPVKFGSEGLSMKMLEQFRISEIFSTLEWHMCVCRKNPGG